MAGSFLATALIITLLASIFTGDFYSSFKNLVLLSPFVFFAAIILTEPLTTPPTRRSRLIYGAIAAFYCIIHIPRGQVVEALREMKRVLKPGGVLLVSFHIGTEIQHIDEFFEKPVNLDFAFYQPNEMEDWLHEAGFELEETLVREPNPEVEVATQRAYLFAKKPKIS